MYAVFVENRFQGFWTNSRHENLSWIELTIQSMGWKKEETTVVRFDQPPMPQQPFSFNENRNIVVLEKLIREVNGIDTDVFFPGTEISGETVYLNGTFGSSGEAGE